MIEEQTWLTIHVMKKPGQRHKAKISGHQRAPPYFECRNTDRISDVGGRGARVALERCYDDSTHRPTFDPLVRGRQKKKWVPGVPGVAAIVNSNLARRSACGGSSSIANARSIAIARREASCSARECFRATPYPRAGTPARQERLRLTFALPAPSYAYEPLRDWVP
jgi:hypothetical protein